MKNQKSLVKWLIRYTCPGSVTGLKLDKEFVVAGSNPAVGEGSFVATGQNGGQKHQDTNIEPSTDSSEGERATMNPEVAGSRLLPGSNLIFKFQQPEKRKMKAPGELQSPPEG